MLKSITRFFFYKNSAYKNSRLTFCWKNNGRTMDLLFENNRNLRIISGWADWGYSYKKKACIDTTMEYPHRIFHDHGIYDLFNWAFIWKVCNKPDIPCSFPGEYTIYSPSVPWYSPRLRLGEYQTPRVNKSYIHLKSMKYLLYINLC